MRLTNPTDDQLNACFAEKVAGWHIAQIGMRSAWHDKDGHFIGFSDDGKERRRFIQSADAVLPWLEKSDIFPLIRRPFTNIISGKREWEVEVSGTLGESKNRAYADTLPKACVIALLRAHGVEVEFTA